MKKLLFSLLGVFLLFQITNAQGNNLSDFIKDSEKTLQAEFSSWEEITIDEDIYDDEYIDGYYPEEYYDEEYYDEDDYHHEDRFDIHKEWDFNEDDIGKLIGFWLGFIWIIFICRIIGFIFWIRMLVDAAKYQKSDRVGWILVLVFFNILWALIYLFAAKIWRKKEDRLDY